MTDIVEQTYPLEKLGHEDNEQMSQILGEAKTNKMCKFEKRDNIYRKRNSFQQDLIQTPSTSIVGICPRQLLEKEYQDYHDKYQDMIQMKNEHGMCIDLYATTNKSRCHII